MLEPATPPTSEQWDEQALAEWVIFGLLELEHLLQRYAEFTRWCERHHRKDWL